MLSSTKKKPQSYAQAAKTVRASQKISLLHTDIQANQHEGVKFNKSLRTRIYRAARTKGAFLFDISSCRGKYTDQQAMMALKIQHPKVHACSVLSDGPTRYLEVYIKDDCDDNNILANGIIFEDSQLQIVPCRAIDDAAKITHLKLSHLPMLTNDEVLDGMHKSLPVFGEVLDIGIYTEKATGFFMGAGYAVINTYQPPNTPKDKKYPVLSHQISWCESKTEMFHATWNNMPTWCRYCHATGHTKFHCEVSKARTLCYSCHQLGHRSAECPRRNATNVPSKKLDRKTYPKEVSKPVPPTPKVTPNSPNFPTISPNIEDDHMSTGGEEDVESIVDEEEQVFRDNVELLKQELDLYSPAQISAAIQQTFEDQEIIPSDNRPVTEGVTEWKIVQRTERSEALVAWLTANKFRPLLSSPSISYRRTSNLSTGSVSSQVETTHNL